MPSARARVAVAVAAAAAWSVRAYGFGFWACSAWLKCAIKQQQTNMLSQASSPCIYCNRARSFKPKCERKKKNCHINNELLRYLTEVIFAHVFDVLSLAWNERKKQRSSSSAFDNSIVSTRLQTKSFKKHCPIVHLNALSHQHLVALSPFFLALVHSQNVCHHKCVPHVTESIHTDFGWCTVKEIAVTLPWMYSFTIYVYTYIF